MFRDGVKIYPLAQGREPAGHAVHQRLEGGFQHHPRQCLRVRRGGRSRSCQKEPVDFIDPELRGLAAASASRRVSRSRPMRACGDPDRSRRRGQCHRARHRLPDARTGDLLLRGQPLEEPFVGGDYQWLMMAGPAGATWMRASTSYYGHREHAGNGGEDGRRGLAIRPGDHRQGREPAGRRAGLQADTSRPMRPPRTSGRWCSTTHRRAPNSRPPSPIPTRTTSGTICRERRWLGGSLLRSNGPGGKEANWLQTVPGKGWYTCLRLYGPLEPWFDKTWRPGEIELVK